MKRFFHNLKTLAVVALAGVAVLATSCDDNNEENQGGTEITERVAALEKRLVSEIAVLQALIDEAVVDCEPNADGGWVVTLADDATITVSCATGTCALAIVEEGGSYYWATPAGEALVDGEGNKISIAGDVCVGKDAEGDTYVSFDEGNSWIAVEGELALFTAITAENDTVTFALSGGESFDVTLAPSFAVTLGEISCNVAGTVVYIPLTLTGNMTQIKVAYINEGSDWTELWGGTPASAKKVFATAYYTQYGEWCPEFIQMEQLENNTIVVDNVPVAGKLAHIFVMGFDAASNTTDIVYTTYTPTGGIQMIYSDESGYDYGMPNVTYEGLVEEDYLSFNVEFTEGTDMIWINTLNKEYTASRFASELVELMTSGWMSTKEMTEGGGYKTYYRNGMGTAEYPTAIVYTWRDKNGKCHEAVFNYEVIEAAQADIDALYGEDEGTVTPR